MVQAAFIYQHEDTLYSVPLKDITYTVTALENIIETEIVQTYVNSESRGIEASFRFPVEGKSALYALEFQIGNQEKIICRILDSHDTFR